MSKPQRLTKIKELKQALEPIAEAIKYNRPDGYKELDWNPDAHAASLTITIREARAVLRALRKRVR